MSFSGTCNGTYNDWYTTATTSTTVFHTTASTGTTVGFYPSTTASNTTYSLTSDNTVWYTVGSSTPVYTQTEWRLQEPQLWDYRINGESNEEYKARADKLRELHQEEIERFRKSQEKSIKLLKDWLSPSEYNYLMEKGELEIPSQIHEDEVWIVKREATARVIKMKKGKPVTEHCILPSIDVPDGDILLSKIILLKTDEEQFAKISNISYVASYA